LSKSGNKKMSTVLILGASRGIGLALAKEYRAAGWKVFASARQAADIEKLSALGMEAFQCDVNDVNDCAALGWRFDDEKIDGAILNAGVISKSTDALDTPSLEEFDRVMHTNVLAAMRILPIIGPMVNNSEGRLAVISSLMGSLSLREGPEIWLYRASKAALNSVLLDVSHSFPHMISVALHPGWVRTDMGGAGATLSPEQSAAGIFATMAKLTKQDNGTFYNYDGNRLSW
jgi:NAD(P)-dependent dehydrogenase (short-subunit alcohol dehydrogenase family)